MRYLRRIIRSFIKEYLSRQDMEDVHQTAQLIHLGQKRRDDSPYISHPIAVYRITKKYYPSDTAAHMLAMLHDTLEDADKAGNLTKQQAFDMIQASIHDLEVLEEINIALDLLTHDKNIPYGEYLQSVLNNPLAAKVKISDLMHNLSHNPSNRQIIKYKTALDQVSIPSYVNPQQIASLKSILEKR